MTTFPGSPRLLKGAIVGIDIFNPASSVIMFQYNPETLTRRRHGGRGIGYDALWRNLATAATGGRARRRLDVRWVLLRPAGEAQNQKRRIHPEFYA